MTIGVRLRGTIDYQRLQFIDGRLQRCKLRLQVIHW
jgi:hypothetical protein